MKLRTEKEVTDRIAEKKKQIGYIEDFLNVIHKGSATKVKIYDELKTFRRELYLLEWFLDDEMPF